MNTKTKQTGSIVKVIVSVMLVAGFVIVLLVKSRKEDNDSVDYTAEITEFVSNLNYDPDTILNVQDIDGGSLKTLTKEESSNKMIDNNLIVCTQKDFNLKQNAEQVAIIRPTNGVIWPGALVKINVGLLNGMPEPITLIPAPVTLRIDLPGIGEKGTMTVNTPSNSNTQNSIDNALDWWNNNKYLEGYVNPSNSSYNAATSYSSEQLALDLGLNVKWASGSVSSQFNFTSSTTTKVAMMTFKQVFYTVTLDTPTEPGSVFAPSVTPEKIKSTFSPTDVPGYVHSVSYGRIIMFRITTTESATSQELEGTMKYSTGVTSVSAKLEEKYQKILKNSSMEVITIGGNAAVASEAVTAENFKDLEPILKGENAVYSKNNPGVPIAYTVKFLKDNRVSKMGFTTDYTATECTTKTKGNIRIKCTGLYVLRFSVKYNDWQGIARSWSSGDITKGNYKMCQIPGGSTNIVVHAKAVWGANIFTKNYDAPQDACFETGGTTFGTNWKSVDCGF